MHISQYTFISILINTKRHCDLKENWVLKDTKTHLDIRNINFKFGMFFYWHLVFKLDEPAHRDQSPQQKIKK